MPARFRALADSARFNIREDDHARLPCCGEKPSLDPYEAHVDHRLVQIKLAANRPTDVGFWPKADVTIVLNHVSFRVNSGPRLRALQCPLMTRTGSRTGS